MVLDGLQFLGRSSLLILTRPCCIDRVGDVHGRRGPERGAYDFIQSR
jgi:hypothetical protein